MYRFLLSFRYFRSRFIALAALLAVTFGVAMLMIVLSVMGGYMVELREIIRGQESHLRLRDRTYGLAVVNAPRLEKVIRSVENVRATAPFIERLAVYKSGLFFKPCELKGVDPGKQIQVNDFGRHVLRPEEVDSVLNRFLPERTGTPSYGTPEVDLQAANRAVREITQDPDRQPLTADELETLFSKEWRWNLLKKAHPGQPQFADPDDVPPAALVGLQLLLERQLRLGRRISVTTLKPDTSEPETFSFVVAGAFKTGEYTFDVGTIYVHLNRLKNLLGLWSPQRNAFRLQGIRIALLDPERLDETKKRIETAVREVNPELEVETWMELRPNLLKAVEIEKVLVSVLVGILSIFTGFMILLMLILTVIEKTRDVGVLMALGATPTGVMSIFLLDGLVICVLGTLLGHGLGYFFCSNINAIHDAIYAAAGIQLFPAEIYHMDRIPIAHEPGDIVLSTLPPVAIGLIASLIPAMWAPHRDPIKTIQYE